MILFFRKVKQSIDGQSRANFKSLNRNRKANGMYSDAHARNNSAPGLRSRKERQRVTSLSTDPRKGIN